MAGNGYTKKADDTFQATYQFTLAGSSGTQYIQFKTGSKVPVLQVVQGTTASSSVVMSLIESPTVTVGTTAISARCIDRNSANTSTVSLYSDPSSISGGTVLFSELIPASNQGSSEHQDTLMRPLKASTSYLVKFLNLGNQSECLVNLVWYE